MTLHLHTRSPCDACGAPATKEGKHGDWFCDLCDSTFIEFSIPSDAPPSDANAPTVVLSPPAVGATNSPAMASEVEWQFEGPADHINGPSLPGRRSLPSQTKRLTGVTGGESAATNSISDGGLAAPRETEMEPSATPALSLSDFSSCGGRRVGGRREPLKWVAGSIPARASIATGPQDSISESSPAPAMAEDAATASGLTDPPVAVAVNNSTPSGALEDVALVTAAGAASCGLAAISSDDPELDAITDSLIAGWRADGINMNATAFRVAASSLIHPSASCVSIPST